MTQRAPDPSPNGDFVHLHVHSEFSLLDGLGRITELVDAAAAQGMDAMAITDHGVMYGVVDFYQAATAAGIKPIIGIEAYVVEGSRFDRQFGKRQRHGAAVKTPLHSCRGGHSLHDRDTKQAGRGSRQPERDCEADDDDRDDTGDDLRNSAAATLERIGGTPCVLMGLASVKRTSRRDSVLRAIMTDEFRRAVLAFPDEDVLVGTRFVDAGGFEAFRTLEDIVPRPGHKATGEERAWGRRLAKRFGVADRITFRRCDFAEVPDGPFGEEDAPHGAQGAAGRGVAGLPNRAKEPIDQPAGSVFQHFEGIVALEDPELFANGDYRALEIRGPAAEAVALSVTAVVSAEGPHASDALAAALQQVCGDRLTIQLAEGGMHLLVRSDEFTNDGKLVARARAHGLAPAPLSVWGVARVEHGLLLSFTNIAEESALGMARRLKRAIFGAARV